MRDQRDLTQDAVLRAQIATANKLIAEQSVAFARAHSAIERAIESLREPDGEGPSVLFMSSAKSIAEQVAPINPPGARHVGTTFADKPRFASSSEIASGKQVCR
jgi:hypothetical protein